MLGESESVLGSSTGDMARWAVVRGVWGWLLAGPGLIQMGLGGGRVAVVASLGLLLVAEERLTAASRSWRSRRVHVTSRSTVTDGEGEAAGLHVMAGPATTGDGAMGVAGGNSGGGRKRRCRQSDSACGDADKGGADRLGTTGGCGQLAGGQLNMPGLTNFVVGRSTGDGGGNGGFARRCERAREEKAMRGRRGTDRGGVRTGNNEAGNPQAK